jgi:hypothetical protein
LRNRLSRFLAGSYRAKLAHITFLAQVASTIQFGHGDQLCSDDLSFENEMRCHFEELTDHEPPKMSSKYGAENNRNLDRIVQEGVSDLIFNGRPTVFREVVDKQNSGR